MKIVVQLNYSRITECEYEDLQDLEKTFSYTETLTIKKKDKDVIVPTVRSIIQNGVTPTGLVPVIEKYARSRGMRVDVVDERKFRHPLVLGRAAAAWLRDFQHECVDTLLENRRGIAKLKTGTGKMEIAIALMLRVQTPCVLLLPQKQLLHEAVNRWRKRTGELCGIIGDGYFDIRRVTMCTYSSATRDVFRKGVIRDAGMIIFDECHFAGAQLISDMILRDSRADYVFGLSATPLDRDDGRDLFVVAGIGPIVYERDKATQVLGDVWIQRVVSKDLRMSAKKIRDVYDAGIVENPERNRLVVDTAAAAEKPALVFVERIPHVYLLADMIRAQLPGRTVTPLHGQMQMLEQQDVLQKLAAGQIDVVVCTRVIKQGTDIPCLRSVINAAGGRSAASAIQRVGRATREFEGKLRWDAYDFYDTGHDWLERHSAARIQAYEKEGYAVHWTSDGSDELDGTQRLRTEDETTCDQSPIDVDGFPIIDIDGTDGGSDAPGDPLPEGPSSPDPHGGADGEVDAGCREDRLEDGKDRAHAH